VTKFGVEEEFMVLNRQTLAPIPSGALARSALRKDAAQVKALSTDEPWREASAEFLDCQVEIATAPATTLDSAAKELESFRRSLRDFAERNEVVVGSVGTPFGSAQQGNVTAKERYRVIARMLGGLAQEHFANGLHVHTEVLDAEERVRALNQVRPWLPVLLALTVNSPFWKRQYSGFASWRSILLRRMPTMGCPPVFHDLDDYERRVDRLVALQAAVDRGLIGWSARVSDHYDTVEVRVFDAQLTVTDTLFAAALTRAIIADPPASLTLDSEAVDAGLWMASREGMDARLVDPITGDVAPAWNVVTRLRQEVKNSLETHGDSAFVDAKIDSIRDGGSGADQQRTALARGGISDLRTLLKTSLSSA